MLEVVMLHHVAAATNVRIGPRAEYVVTPGQLNDYLERRRGWRPLSGTSTLQCGHTERCFLITFDDGYRNNLTEALPVLEAHGVPCILFITTGFVEGTIYPYEIELARVAETLPRIHLTDGTVVELHSISDRKALYQQLRTPLKSATHSRRESFLNRLAERNGYHRENFQKEPILNWEEVHDISRHPLVTIGAHTHSHLLLSSQWWGTAYREIWQSREALEDKLGCRVSIVSYPYGGHSFVVRRLTQTLGFEYGFTTEPRRAKQIKGPNQFRIPRIDINQFART